MTKNDSRQRVEPTGIEPHSPQSAEPPFSPYVEIGWRLAFRHWGKGFASEAAKEVLRIGFHLLGLKEIVSFAAVGNLRSRAVIERLGMCESGTFENPQPPEKIGLRTLCLYRLDNETHVA